MSRRERSKLAMIGGFMRPRDELAHGTHHAAFQFGAAIVEAGTYSEVHVYHDNARAKGRSPDLLLPRRTPTRILDQARLPVTREEYSAIYVANGEQIGPVPFVLRPNHDWAPVVVSIGSAHTAPQWQSLLVALASGSVRDTDGFVFKSKAARRLFADVWGDWRERLGVAPPFPRDSIVIPNGVDTAALGPSPALRQRTRQLLRIDRDDIVFLAFSRLSPGTKGDQLALIARWREVAQRSPRALLVVSGAQVDRSFVMELRQLARQAGVADRVLVVENPFEVLHDARNALMSAADVFVHLTTGVEETSSLVVHEAMAHALPIIASDWAGLGELVVNGESGHLVPTYAAAVPGGLSATVFGTADLPVILAASRAVHCDYSEFVQAALALTDHERRRRMGTAARRASERGDLANIARAYVDYFDQVSLHAQRAWASPRVNGFRPLVDLDQVLKTQASNRLHPRDRVRLTAPERLAWLTAGFAGENQAEAEAVIAAFEQEASVDLLTLACAVQAVAAPANRSQEDAFELASRLLVRMLNMGIITRLSTTT